nr:uncharacterized protein LOC121470751 [Taeniopygia guttata]
MSPRMSPRMSPAISQGCPQRCHRDVPSDVPAAPSPSRPCGAPPTPPLCSARMSNIARENKTAAWQQEHRTLAGLAQGKEPPSRVWSCAMELGASGKAAGAGAGAEPSFEHQEVGGPAGQQQRPEQHRVAEQHKGQQLPQHLEEVDGEGVRHGSPGSLGLAAPCSSLAWKQRNKREAAPDSCRLRRAIPVMESMGSHSTSLD